jgi:hypothetical protein
MLTTKQVGDLMTVAYLLEQKRGGKQRIKKILGGRIAVIKGKKLFYDITALKEKSSDDIDKAILKMERLVKK